MSRLYAIEFNPLIDAALAVMWEVGNPASLGVLLLHQQKHSNMTPTDIKNFIKV